MSRNVTDREYLFSGGPWDQRRVKTGGVKVFRVPVPKGDLESLLRASIDQIEKRVTTKADQTYRVAQYVLERRVPVRPGVILFDREAYRFDGWER